jgi:hypothetical protein
MSPSVTQNSCVLSLIAELSAESVEGRMGATVEAVVTPRAKAAPETTVRRDIDRDIEDLLMYFGKKCEIILSW